MSHSKLQLPIAKQARTGLRVLAVLSTLSTLGLAGCGLTPTCGETNEPYRDARSIPALKVPAGLDAPAHTGGMNVPAAAQAPAPAGSTAAVAPSPGAGKCLDEAPSYFGGAISPLSLPEEIVAIWAEAWSERNTERMMAAYSPTFAAPEGITRDAWLEQRREQVATGPVPTAGVQGLKMTQPTPERRVATFAQRFGNNTIRRELTFAREGGFWRIVQERVLEVE